ncbi:testis-expressed protein 2 isoform X1 [Drosophila gunungcola]|nr:testis-expressed protein 2 isoform X1 [Drosophila gunungcola]XP_052846560.1 testis-expressed protein 2 isoform X1 [Drosophila gunungcola]XP_052846562.1 testis-expressed protein 2 isoform X1 [Drosophila gunungcola]XP_052846563.1 testis-expressed protein 2 isoform X1 [Drosophila gunungcola]XP_052846564.1 testis-expressed protein 2 isoform X1 [Drosophila gunungcola]XP_052846565.1 testis-expressed protein 2 isoform X1 [Drosophila gunungcola]
MDSLKLPKGNSATSSASGSNSNLSGSTSASASAATSPTSSGNNAAGGILTGAPKSPPGLSSSTPITVRFNANEESLDDILQSFHHSKHSPSGGASGGNGGDASPTSNLLGMKNNGLGLNTGLVVGACDSLSSSPSQPQMQGGSASLFGNDEVTLRNNFLQGGGFFNRKRSGSIEGVSPTSSGPSLISALSSASAGGGSLGGAGPAGDSSSGGGTWRLIKGKVSQTIEEIKSSKLPPTAAIPIIVSDPPSTGWSNDPDSDTECLTVNTSISEELPLDQEHKQNSDSDVEAELLQHDTVSLGSLGDVAATGGQSERSRLRRGLAHIRSKVKAKHQAAAAMKKDISPSGSGSAVPPTTVRTGFLRRRNVVEAGSEPSTSQQAEIAIVSGKVKKRGILLARKDVEVESGVEVLEDMIPATVAQSDASKEPAEKRAEDEPDLVADAESRPTLTLPVAPVGTALAFASSYTEKESQKSPRDSRSKQSFLSSLSMLSVSQWREKHQGSTVFALPVLLSFFLLLLMILPVPDFLRGVFATLLFFTVMDCCGGHLRVLLEDFLLTTHPERVAFAIPNYKVMPICEIPAVEEHKTIKTYAGWMNEINSYDPNTFSFSLTRAVYVRLDGCILKMSGTNARIPKRRMWNEPPIDRHKILFTDHRSYDLRDCRIELLPLGLANKRFFNRKYPIQLIIKSTKDLPEEQSSVESQSEQTVKLEAKEVKGASSSGATPPGAEEEKPVDFAATVMQADLQQLRNTVNPDKELNDISVPCGDEVRLLLFSRCDREKEDWYRRFTAASKGLVHEQDLQVPMARFVEDTDLQAAAARQALHLVTGMGKGMGAVKWRTEDEMSTGNANDEPDQQTPDGQFENVTEEDLCETPKEENFDGMIMSANVARNPPDYVRFMAVYQKACSQSTIPVTRSSVGTNCSLDRRQRKSRRAKRQEDELWKGIDQSLFLGPSGSIVWANVLLGRCLYSWLHDAMLHEKLKEVLQKKLNSIKLPSFMEEVIITNIYLGQSPLLCHRVSQPMLDERGVWVDADVTYEGLAHITVTTKLNLLRIRSKTKSPMAPESVPTTSMAPEQTPDLRSNSDANSENVIYDSDAESSGGSSTESESPPPGTAQENPAGTEFFQNSPGNARRIFKIVDRIAASNLFQYATELPYVQRAMENMNANITLRVDLKGLVARGTLNVPPPPSDRVWVSFRGPPRLWISTKPQVGDKSVDWSIVTNVIESKLCEAVNKFLVYPNMVDFSIPFLSNPNFDEEPATATN